MEKSSFSKSNVVASGEAKLRSAKQPSRPSYRLLRWAKAGKVRRCALLAATFCRLQQRVSRFWIIISLLVLFLLPACQAASPSPSAGTGFPLKVLAVESFLADIAQNVAGNRLKVDSLIPIGLDPHAFEPTPADAARIADSQVLIINGAGLESWLQKVLDNVGIAPSGATGGAAKARTVIEASTGLANRAGAGQEIDPHFWLDPNEVIQYVENIRDGLIQADPQGKELYTQNATAYITQLQALDQWILQQVDQIPPEHRLLVTNHESLGYFADRYGFKIIGTVVPGTNSEASPSARQLSQLIDAIKQSGAPAIFLETGANPKLADQVALETGVKVVTDLYTHSITEPGGKAPTYIDMMKYNTQAIVSALK